MAISIEILIRRLIERQQVDRVEITTHDGKTFTATAYPASHHPIVSRRRVAASARLADRTTTSREEMQQINDRAHNEKLCQGSGFTINRAVAELITAIQAINRS